jgi:hypothetical protein
MASPLLFGREISVKPDHWEAASACRSHNSLRRVIVSLDDFMSPLIGSDQTNVAGPFDLPCNAGHE